MKKLVLSLIPAIILSGIIAGVYARSAREFLTEEETESIQIKQEIGPRIQAYLSFAALRLKSAEARLLGAATEPGDPLEYFTPEDMLDGYYRIMNSVMLNLEEAARKAGGPDNSDIRKTLKELYKSTETSLRRLEFLEKLATEQNKQELLRLIHRAVDITNGAHEGAGYGLSEKSDAAGKKE